MRLSILDQAPISSNQTPRDALLESLQLAQAGERLGYTRFWVAEHHDLAGLACSAPEVMLAYIGANTKTIRIGSGAVLLPYYRPYKVAETFNMLATLFPDRIDIGIGRAPGGSAEATNALSDQFLQQVWDLPKSIMELLHFIYNDFPSDHEYVKVQAAPLPDTAPVPWLLGTSKKSALLAAKTGLSYAFGQFMSDNDGKDIIKQYLDHFKPKRIENHPNVILTVSVICAETNEKAEEIALSSLLWSIQKEQGEGTKGVPSIQEAIEYPYSVEEKQKIEKIKQKMIIGNPLEVKQKLINIQASYQANEIMLVTITYSPEDRLTSYRLIAEAFM
ncbi:LLM class flavin-dependent oxidoreductase [Metabacillus halosaccharovorans]|uniref:LLM class flavin-dependent oxidoreductase n=1 Tax=Metabacillus halosaccharovorans TaxID=930124 RepID=UPI001C1F2422|nr:LLM class flavin-dependent oxidoreductase [Metabacillus halosaccharovorans]MBU7592419.1 LLM class flavin-dependent oxidoreductase [Metabacillus halosaccharovorans]